MTAAYVADTDLLGLGRPDHEPKATRDDRRDHRPDRGARSESDHAYERGRRRLLPRGALRRLRQALEPPAGGDAAGRGRRRRRAEGGAAGLRALEGAQGGRGHLLGVALGRRPARLAHRVLGDGRGAARQSPSRSTAAARTSSSRTTRTRSRRPRRRAASRWRALWMHNGMVADGRREDGQVGGQHPPAARRHRAVRPRRVRHVDGRRPLPQAGRLHRGGARGRRPRRGARARADPAAGRSMPTARRSSTTSSRALLRRPGRRLQHRRRPRRAVRLGRRGQPPHRRRGAPRARAPRRDAATRSGSRRCWRPTTRRRRTLERLAAEREEARAARDFERADRMRDELAERGWEIRDTAEGARLVRRVIVYGRNPVREALRGRRRVQRVFATERAAQRGVAGGRRDGDRGAVGARGALRLARPPGRSAPRSGPYPYVDADSLLDAEDALVLCLDEVQDPHNLGAVCRVAEAAGCAGVVLPERRSAEVTPAVCQASAGAVEHLPVARVRNLADWLGDPPRSANAWVYGAAADAATCPTTGRTTAGASCWCWGARGAGCARAWPRPATSSSRCPTAARSGRSTCPPRPRRWCTESCSSANGALTGIHNQRIIRPR